jgi:peptidoglycan/xylan/chitin deacetylase (PgdA/CDA1 family)
LETTDTLLEDAVMRDALPEHHPESLQTRFKRVILRIAKCLGLFSLARRLTGQSLRILCYHAFSLQGESRFHPKLFMEPATFGKRLQWLRDHRYPVLPLSFALEALDKGTLPRLATVITIDDGFHSVYSLAVPLLRRFQYPATVYVTSYYVFKGTPIFELALRYMLWGTNHRALDVAGLGLKLDASRSVSIASRSEKESLISEILRYGELECDHAQRIGLLRALAERLQIDYDAIATDRLLSLMDPAELAELGASGIDIQLHSHRHRFPEDEHLAMQEITDNRTALQPLLNTPLRHFCYPDGFWSPRHWPWLSAATIESATTCERGLNLRSTPRFALKRFLDGEHISDIEFEAELSGFTEFLRRARAIVRRLAPGPFAASRP